MKRIVNITDTYFNWYKNASEADRSSVYLHVIYTCSSLPFKDRIKIAFEILMGREYCIKQSNKGVNDNAKI
jgi:hypothetical protein